MRLPAVVGKLYKAINRNGGVTYAHCTAGLGRAPAVAVCTPNFFVFLPQIYFFLEIFYDLDLCILKAATSYSLFC